MFVTETGIKQLTDVDATPQTIIMAQAIIEAYAGRVESEVDDPNDLMLLARATAYQVAYMHRNPERTFEQVAATQIMQFGQMMSFDPKSAAPFVAPLAVIACQRLSWKRMRSVKTGSIFHNPPVVDDWSTS